MSDLGDGGQFLAKSNSPTRADRRSEIAFCKFGRAAHVAGYSEAKLEKISSYL